ncbi:glycosyltransferase family 4 protein [Actinopolymorpha alba]|uniref:glycosyltransferase family 4 protein n=1 Tax=Actinopolymorpha alba TaxID=533267 RepID=UPI0003622370|nr:glycosyltransferase family 1 protein [Actinopolymorpha alba]
MVVAESFLPQVNGVANSVRHLVDHLVRRGHQALVVAPGPGDTTYAGTPVVRVRSLPLPMYPDFPLGLPDGALRKAVTEFAPDLIHLASPLVLGMSGLRTAERYAIPTVAVYQTDVVGFAQQYGFVGVERTLWAWTRRMHVRAGRTLAPSRAALDQLHANQIPRLYCWPRGVDLRLFQPSRRDAELRRRLAPDGEVLVGYVGRVATEKRVHLLRRLADLPGTRLVVVGSGPALEEVRAIAPGAATLGMLSGVDLARAIASLDIFVHTGAHETFCQAAQEALASGVPVVAPAAGGLLDLVTPGETGLLYPPEESPEAMDAFRAAVLSLAGEPVLRSAMGRAARASVLDRGWEPILDELIDVHYRGVLRQPTSPDLAA